MHEVGRISYPPLPPLRSKKTYKKSAHPRRQGTKVFRFFFSKKNILVPSMLFLLAAAPPPQPAHTEQVPPDRAVAILGATVTGPDKRDIGRIVDVLVDGAGKPQAAVIDFGGFFGVGSRKVAVSWTNLNFAPAAKPGGQISLDLTADQIKAAPDYHDTTPAAVVTAKKPEQPPTTIEEQ